MANRPKDTFKPTADKIAFLNRGRGPDAPDVQNAIEKVWSELERKAPTTAPYSVTDEPVTGAKTITATASPLYAGASPLSGRRQLSAYNDGEHTFYIGGAGVSSQTGFPVFPGQSVTVHFDPDVYVPLYAVTESGQSVAVRIWESK